MAGRHRDGATQDQEVRRAWLGGFVIGAMVMLIVWMGVLVWNWL